MAVLETNEWNNITQPGWIYNHGYDLTGAFIDNAPTGGSSASGGSAIRMVQPFNMPGGVGGGVAQFTSISGQSEFYVGFWLKHSTNFVWHPIASKFYYQYVDGPDASGTLTENFVIAVKSDGNIRFTQQMNAAPGSYNRDNTVSAPLTPLGTWRWIEVHSILNTVGIANGTIEVRINNVLVLHYTDIIFRSNTRFFGKPEMNSTWGGSGSTIPATQYIWFDHTVISTTAIGMPSGGPPDTTPPLVPTGVTVS